MFTKNKKKNRPVFKFYVKLSSVKKETAFTRCSRMMLEYFKRHCLREDRLITFDLSSPFQGIRVLKWPKSIVFIFFLKTVKNWGFEFWYALSLGQRQLF